MSVWRRFHTCVIAVILISLAIALSALGGEAQTQDKNPGERQRLNIPWPTLGGKQLWADVKLYGGWRIQRHVVTDHYRLLDRRDTRRAWGTLGQCNAALDDAKRRGRATVRSRKMCLLVHGYFRSKDSMKGLKEGLEKAGYEVYSVNYPSMQSDIKSLSKQIGALTRGLADDFDEINIVTHSMGGIIARVMLNDGEYPKLGRIVMIAPPNQGAVLADVLLDWWPSQYVTGSASKELSIDAESVARSAGTPPCPFGIIAGARGTEEGWNPIIPGDDDGVVGLSNTRLQGAADFAVVKSVHTTIMNAPKTIEYVLRFLKEGRFKEE